MITNVPKDQFLQNETSKINATDDDKDTTKINNFPYSTDLAIEDMLPEEQISYSSYSVICDNLYNNIKNKNQISKYFIGLLLKMKHVINNTTDKNITLSRLLELTKQLKSIFSNMKKSTDVMLEEPIKNHKDNRIKERRHF